MVVARFEGGEMGSQCLTGRVIQFYEKKLPGRMVVGAARQQEHI